MATRPGSGNVRGPFGWRVLIGLLLVFVGALLMFEVTGVLRLGSVVWGGVAVVGAVLFTLVWLRDRAQWWAWIPAGAMMGIAAVLLAPGLLPTLGLDQDRAGPLFLMFLGMGFGLAYAANRAQWWALIPMGSLWTVATVALFESTNEVIGEPGVASVTFFGLAATFLLVAFAPGGRERIRPWALIPAGVLMLIGVLVAGSFTSILNLIAPLTLMVVGVVLLLTFFFRRR